jgi:hypothetical protein
MRGGGAASPVGFLLNRAGQLPDPGQGAPQRVPMGQGLMPKSGPNETEYQKMLLLQLLRSTPVVQPTAFQRGVTIGFSLTVVGADVLAITSPPEIRSFLLIRNDQSSPGNAFVALDTQASAATAFVTLSPGGYILMDSFVLQNDIHIAAATAGTTLVVITYANARFSPSPI